MYLKWFNLVAAIAVASVSTGEVSSSTQSKPPPRFCILVDILAVAGVSNAGFPRLERTDSRLRSAGGVAVCGVCSALTVESSGNWSCVPYWVNSREFRWLIILQQLNLHDSIFHVILHALIDICTRHALCTTACVCPAISVSL